MWLLRTFPLLFKYHLADSIVFIQFPWPLLAKIGNKTRYLHLIFSSRHVSTSSAQFRWWF